MTVSPSSLYAHLRYPVTKMATVTKQTLGVTVWNPTFEFWPWG